MALEEKERARSEWSVIVTAWATQRLLSIQSPSVMWTAELMQRSTLGVRECEDGNQYEIGCDLLD
jgi:hypothetical protein